MLSSRSIETHPPTRVLIVDDDATYRQIMEKVLRRRGYAVWTAASGEAAVELAGAVELALVDMIMPGMDGLETIAELRWRNPALRFIASSGLSESLFRAELERLGVTSFLAKPFPIERLLAEVDAHAHPVPA